jgi:alkanesulfonate monooxygenase SsuD/methylene tetrahydromethanopterin reductase-like flavin-dependent oxidoreductase (luciferase family)
MMDYWIHTAGVPVADMVELAERADALGFRGILFSEHLVEPPPPEETRGRYPYNPDGLQGGIPYPDPWVLTAALVGVTESLEFATAVAVLPLHETFALARSVATASVLSDGRVRLGVGSGWWADEFAAVDSVFADRGGRTDVMIDELRTLWSGGAVDRPAGPARLVEPLPGPVPVLVGGHSSAARRRAAVLDGWIGAAGFLDVDGIVDVAAQLLHRRRELGLASDGFEIIDRPRGALGRSDVDALGAAGVTGVIAFAGRRWRERIGDFAAELIGAVS